MLNLVWRAAPPCPWMTRSRSIANVSSSEGSARSSFFTDELELLQSLDVTYGSLGATSGSSLLLVLLELLWEVLLVYDLSALLQSRRPLEDMIALFFDESSEAFFCGSL